MDATFLSFSRIGEHYPTVRALVPESVLPFVAALAPVARSVFGLRKLAIVDSFYSVVTTPPQDLAPIQRLPHFDEVSPKRIALLHYPSPDEEAAPPSFATARPVTSRSMPRGSTLAVQRSLTIWRATGWLRRNYLGADSPAFERTARHQERFNRAILYRSHTLHCADIPAAVSLSADPHDGRPTVNTFLDARG